MIFPSQLRSQMQCVLWFVCKQYHVIVSSVSGGYIYHGHCKIQYANVKATDDSKVGNERGNIM